MNDALPDTETRLVKRFLYSAAFETSIDAQGRLLIPPHLCQYAGLTKNVKVIGVGNRVEIWDAAAWDQTISAVDIDQVISTMEKLGL